MYVPDIILGKEKPLWWKEIMTHIQKSTRRALEYFLCVKFCYKNTLWDKWLNWLQDIWWLHLFASIFFCGWLDFCWNKAHKCYKGSRLIDWDKVLALPQTLNLRRNLFEMKLLRTNRVPKCLFKFNFPFPFAVTTVTAKIIATIKVVITNRVVIQKVCYFKFKYSFKFNFPFPFAVTTVTTKIIARIIVVITNRVVIQKVCYSGKGE